MKIVKILTKPKTDKPGDRFVYCDAMGKRCACSRFIASISPVHPKIKFTISTEPMEDAKRVYVNTWYTSVLVWDTVREGKFVKTMFSELEDELRPMLPKKSIVDLFVKVENFEE